MHMGHVTRTVRRIQLQRAQSGVTLVELIIALMVLFVGMFGALAFMSIALTNSLNANKLLLARNLAEETLNQIIMMREMNAIGGIPEPGNRNQNTFIRLSNRLDLNGIFPPEFRPVYRSPGRDMIRGTADPDEISSGIDPRYESFTMRVLVRTAFTTSGCFDKEYDNSYDLSNDSNCPPESNTDLVKRVIVQVRYPYTRVAGSALRTVQIVTLMTQPPSQIRGI
ncbi:prepilin-type N-terminal cleavage/methylation domain protein [Chloracidobacterium thermophilum B]|uniref:Prepilin-type N-terminal cleavage/methylation domain protein n=2 Tax=Chloracidobacterium thermophilum TaxID=458033 RepID=G2LGU9_CHLTF|nr:prepilin-type N-terminal cleavage/methylation domain protein [Chloracidobacterium thermophilum B]